MDGLCAICNRILKNVSGQLKVLSDNNEVDIYSKFTSKVLKIGDKICNKCRLLRYRSSSSSALQSLEETPLEEIIEVPINRVVSTHSYCCLCYSKTKFVTVPLRARLQAYQSRRIFIPKQNRCCPSHLIKDVFYKDELSKLKIHSNVTNIEPQELVLFLDNMSINSNTSIFDLVENGNLSEERLHALTGFNWEQFTEIRELLSSSRDSSNRTVSQALFVFLFKLRSGNSNATIASILGIMKEQQVSDYFLSILNAFEKDVLPNYFGISCLDRKDLIENQTSIITKKLLDIENELVLIFDGTYIRHQKSTNYSYQRKSYSGQKKQPLCKPFTICTTTGYIVDIAGPFYGTENDASIMKKLLSDPNGISSILQANDYCVVDRGFRDVIEDLSKLKYKILIPAFKGKSAQLSTKQSNESRFVTKIRWPVECIHGIIGQKFKLLHHQLDNKMLPNIRALCRIAGFLQNKYGKAISSDKDLSNEIVARMQSQRNIENDLADYVTEKNLNKKRVSFKKLNSNDLLDFPELSLDELKILFTGTYQLSQAISYLAEMMDKDDNVLIEFYTDETAKLLRLKVRSRHISKRTYNIYIKYNPEENALKSVAGYCCDCPNGRRTVGCCSHISACIYYLTHARYLSKRYRPAEDLYNLFDNEDVTTIDTDSEEE